jgi:phosphoenolpyruvate-protein phosphotransferase/dihydroxyacetone kinase phosphotransfer subunit
VVGLVLVSHSAELAEGTALLAREMGGDDVAIATAGGLDGEGGIGTDAMRVLAAVEAVWSEDGVLVVMDLGSALLSAEMALDLLEPDRRARVLLSDAPFVEGAVAAAVAAKLGRSLEEVEREARGGLAGKAAHLGADALPADASVDIAPEPRSGPELRVTLDVDLPHGLHARPAARLVQTASAFDADVRISNVSAGRGPVSARSLNAVATLGVTAGQRIEIVAQGPQASLVMDGMRALADRRFDETAEESAPSSARPGQGPLAGGALRGIAASPGAVVGPARHLRVPDLPIPEGTGGPAGEERGRLEHALAAVRADVLRTRDHAQLSVGRAEAAIFDAHLLFLQDEALLTPAQAGIAAGRGAAASWSTAVGRLAAAWGGLEDPYLRERAADLRSVGRQVLARILGIEAPQARLEATGILVATDLEPADTVGLDPDVCLGIAVARGGPTSHAAILARALGIPAVVGLGEQLLTLDDGVTLGLDGVAGIVYVDPPASTITVLETAAQEMIRRERAARARATTPASTEDGVEIPVLANVGGPAELAAEVSAAVAAGCDGVGLLRTEFLFIGRPAIPDEDEQERVYRAAAVALAGRPLTIRTLDVGADKPIPGIAQPPEANPFLGVRGIRLGLYRPDLLGTQLRAVARVAVDHDVRVLFPMIATVDELHAALAALDDAAGDPSARPPAGVMIEVPSAALLASHLASEVAFLSIGTNDLTQYVLAADRGNDRVSAIADPLHPAVLRMIAEAAEAADACGIPAAVCGELAGDPNATALLVGLGVRELSMSAPAIPAVKDAVRRTNLEAAQALATDARSRASAAEVRAILTALNRDR